MAKELVTLLWCDGGHGETQEPATGSHRVTIDGKEREVDLCEACAKALIEPLRTLLEQAGQPVTPAVARAAKPAKPGASATSTGKVKLRATCPVCEETFAARMTTLRHALRVHDFDINDYEKQRGVDVCGQPLTVECPECGNQFHSGHGLYAHAKQEHGHGVAAIPLEEVP